ncbi:MULTISPECIES: SDR family oxidoreductase [Phyllobacteriaceae]|jgi:3-oxoacyl-[acyl-carrier protein] reductase|uniref:3-oxoacyl-ACP reductase n=1 Tax=Mesorhizobium hungaricum TaxID=1566387 RepID=A0A1C2DSY9_9HYPH|nr:MULTISPECIES: SDR family oxidoreductase [Mesorhizobium]MBN9235966.1 SDR family oxidoreductase [Mesorhizobium sp.]MDQ0327987.1 3-oxoacyl-[acyl-carrier protein] reductase [Mesorhizobium sp. YL-MeA3-2017]OCX17877.1 3-oxoacyl-ACP reductase [Mesorhizobium hungaricum]
MDLGIRGKKAIVCASSKGLGRGCAVALAEAGCDLVLNGRDAALLARTAADIRQRFGVDVIEVPGDVSKPDVQKALLAACPSSDILVNNNGGPPYRDFRELDREKILEGVTNNMVTPIELVKAVIDGMATRGFGRIVNITSLSVYMPIPGLDLSSGARAGLTSFLAGVARTVIDRNVTINSLLPGKLDTDRLRGPHEPGSVETPEAAAARKARLGADIPAKRLGTPEEFGQICAFLCSVHAGYLTGQNIPVDGGLYVSAF